MARKGFFYLATIIIVVSCVGLSGCQAFLPAVSFSCRHGEFGPSATLEAAKINEELIYNLSSLCQRSVSDEATTTE